VGRHNAPRTLQVPTGFSFGSGPDGEGGGRHRAPPSGAFELAFPVAALAAAGGGGGAHRAPALTIAPLSPQVGVRLIATVVAGGAVAAGGHAVLTEVVPLAAEGAASLRVGVERMVGTLPAETVVAAPVVTLAPVVLDTPAAPDAAPLVKAVDLEIRAAELARAEEAARVARAEEAARAAEAARAEKARRAAESAPAAAAPAVAAAGGVQMLPGGRVTSGFGARGGSKHWGLDIAAPIGTPIRVPLDGTVISSGPASGFGLWVRVEHDDGTITVYGHINRSMVGVGERVTAGQVIAEVGNRGQSTGPHLHIEVVDPAGYKVNPRPWLDSRGIGY
jgi:murein DD-endopeptidase MepM/ murein hydrolase activator NlpD